MKAIEQVMKLDPDALAQMDLDSLVPTFSNLMEVVEVEVAQRNVPGHTPFQIQRFIMEEIGDQVTGFGAAFQALRELSTRHGALIQASSSYQKARGQLKINLARQMELKSGLNDLKHHNGVGVEAQELKFQGQLEILEAKIIETRGQIINAVSQAENSAREMEAFWKIYQEVAPDDYVENFDAYDRREWRARTLMRTFVGKFSYLPPLEVEEVEILVACGIALRVKGFSEKQARKFTEELWDDADPSILLVNFMVKNDPQVRRPRFPVSAQDFIVNKINEDCINVVLSMSAEEVLDDVQLIEWRKNYKIHPPNPNNNR